MILGLRRGTVAVEPHDPAWEQEAQACIGKLRALLPDVLTDAQHIGSTAVRHICAKPIIDIVLGVPDFPALLARNDLLAENGFLFRGQLHPEQFLYVRGGTDFRTHHIHAVIYRSEAWENYIAMRDYLNSHPADAQAYSALKQTLATQYPDDRETYTAMKSAFIQDILTKAAARR